MLCRARKKCECGRRQRLLFPVEAAPRVCDAASGRGARWKGGGLSGILIGLALSVISGGAVCAVKLAVDPITERKGIERAQSYFTLAARLCELLWLTFFFFFSAIRLQRLQRSTPVGCLAALGYEIKCECRSILDAAAITLRLSP